MISSRLETRMEASQKIQQNNNKERENELEKEITTLESLLRRARKELRELKIPKTASRKRKRVRESIADWVVGC